MGYWEDRQAKLMYEAMEKAESTSKEIANLYAKATREINYQLELIYDRFVGKHDLSEEEARRLLNSLSDSTDIKEMLDALAQDPKNKELQAELEAPAYRARIERLENLQLEIDRTMQTIYGQEKLISSDHYLDLIQSAYYHEIYAIQNQVGFSFSFASVDEKMIDRFLNTKWLGENYSSRIWTNTQRLAAEMKEQLLIGLITGKRELDMADELASKFSTGAFQARRLVRTESNFMYSQAQLQAQQECGIEKYQYIATLDLRTSKECRALDNEVFERKDARVGVNMPPIHPFCRSTIVGYLEGHDTTGLKRRARNPITGKNELVPADTDYRTWYKNNVQNNAEAKAEEKKIKNKSSDSKQYETYKEVLGKRAPKTFDDFQDLKYNDSEAWGYVKTDYSRKNALRKEPSKALPNTDNMVIAEEKFTKYLFGGENARGLAKGNALESRLGYQLDNYKKLDKEIREAAKLNTCKVKEMTAYGQKYEQKIILYGLNGTPANAVVGWIAEKGSDKLKMTTIYIKELKDGV